MKFKITYVRGDSNARLTKLINAESAGEAVELFEWWAEEQFPDFGYDFVRIDEATENE